MTPHAEMPTTRRRPIPGMAPSAPPPDHGDAPASPPAQRAKRARRPASDDRRRPEAAESADRTAGTRRPAADYATTRLVNFRLPADLHDRFKQLVRDLEDAHPRLRHPSLTELVIALLEEGPATPDEVAELIRRKRAAEHEPRP